MSKNQIIGEIKSEIEEQLMGACTYTLDIEIKINKYKNEIVDFSKLKKYGGCIDSLTCIVDISNRKLLFNEAHLERGRVSILLYG